MNTGQTTAQGDTQEEGPPDPQKEFFGENAPLNTLYFNILPDYVLREDNQDFSEVQELAGTESLLVNLLLNVKGPAEPGTIMLDRKMTGINEHEYPVHPLDERRDLERVTRELRGAMFSAVYSGKPMSEWSTLSTRREYVH